LSATARNFAALRDLRLRAVPATKEQFNPFIAAESTRFANVISSSKISID